MKISLLACCAVLTAAAAASWQADRKLKEARQLRATLLAEAAASGTPMTETGSTTTTTATAGVAISQESSPGANTLEPGERAEALKLSADLMVFAQEMRDLRQQGREQTTAEQTRSAGILSRVASLSPAQLKMMIDSAARDPSLTEATRQDLMDLFLFQLSKKSPVEALAIWRRSPKILTNDSHVRNFVTAALSGWSRQDPRAAADWLVEAQTTFPDAIDGRAANGIVQHAAAMDPTLALELAGKLKIGDRPRLLADIGAAANTPESRIAALKALRAFVAASGDAAEQGRMLAAAMPALAKGAAKDGFAACASWLENANLKEREAAIFISGIPVGREEEQWIDWTGTHLPPGQAEPIIAKRIAQWTESDHQAAGEWLNTLPPGSPGRETAISAFAATVARYDPEAAERWALTLPAGPRQQETFRQIHANWPAIDPASAGTGAEAAKAFAQRHGLP